MSRTQWVLCFVALTVAGAVVVAFLLLRRQAAIRRAAQNPVTAFYAQDPDAVPAWIGQLPWERVYPITDFSGADDDARVAAAIRRAAGGGVVSFSPGTYRFKNHLDLADGVILRGVPPDKPSAKDEKYELPVRFEFPKYEPSMVGEGTPTDTAFKCIRLADPAKASGCGVVHIAINRGHIFFDENPDHQVGARRLVFGCLLTNTAAADENVPNPAFNHQPHQRWTKRHRAAIHMFAAQDLFVANNRIPSSGDDNFVVRPYSLLKVGRSLGYYLGSKQKAEPFTLPDGVLFDYDNRPGIYANMFGMPTKPPEPPQATPETHPYGFRKGTIIRDNYIYCTGRTAIAFCGDGVYCGFNVIRFPEGVARPTATGETLTDGGATNDNRAITMRGYRWTAEGNDYVVFSNLTSKGGVKINDGEGIMHEAFHNSILRDSKMLRNTGNQYLCIWSVPVDGLLIEGNKITAKSGAIHVAGAWVKRVRVLDNELTAGGISVGGGTVEDVQVRGNRYTGVGTATITLPNAYWAGDNTNFTVQVPPQKPTPK